MSHNLRLISSLTKVVSPRLKKHAVNISRAAYSSSSQSPPPSAISSKPDKTDKKAFSVPPRPTEEPKVVEKGDTYKAGETYYSFNEYSFYDFEKNMHQHRTTQPSALPKA
ncbi:hypothetical protein Btru_015236 [Bulinus truncatus]|nr:hypothetical protein Btru_015236 [Bulinus truncatus]